jgi:hypothetical protein
MADHEACGGAAKPENRVGNLLGPTKPADRYVFQHRVKSVSFTGGHHLVSHRRMDEPRRPHVAKGRLKRVLADWCPPYSGYHLYYPSRRQSSAAFALLVDALRHWG